MPRLRMTLPLSSLLLFAACDGDLGEAGTDTEDSSAADDGTAAAPGDGPALFCSAATPCPDGQFCFNGLCALGCTSDGNCADNQYCDTFSMTCQNADVSSCDGGDTCLGEQICLAGLCSAGGGSSCDPGAPVDGCETDAICFADDEDDGPRCYTMPACSSEGTCPVGLSGGVCNDGFLPEKGRICLVGGCTEDSHCPADWSCVFGPLAAGLGSCSSGLFGSICNDEDDCMSGVCNVLAGGFAVCG